MRRGKSSESILSTLTNEMRVLEVLTSERRVLLPVHHGFVIGWELGEVHLLELLSKVAWVREVCCRDAELCGDVSKDPVQMLDHLLLL